MNTPCADIDECAGVDCGPEASCTHAVGEENPGQYTCNCVEGTEGGGVNAPCIDPIDECEIDELACGDNQVCSNGIGRADCACAAGYVHEEQWVVLSAVETAWRSCGTVVTRWTLSQVVSSL